MTDTYFAAPDANGELTLWHGTGTGPDDSAATAVATKHELDRMDPVLWPTLVAALTRTPRVWLNDQAPPTGTVILDDQGHVERWNEADWDGDEPRDDETDATLLYNGNSGALVEVFLPDYDSAVARVVPATTGGDQ